MKKLLLIILSLAMICTLFSCKKQSPSTNLQQETTQSPSTEESTDSIQQKPMYAISLVPQTQVTKDTSEKVRFRHTSQNLTLVLPEPEVADKIILDYLSQMDQSDAYALTLQEDSMDPGYDTLLSLYLPLYYSINYTPSRFDTNILSFEVLEIVYTGGVHAFYNGYSATYSLLTGDTLQLTDVLSNDTTSEYLANTVIEKLSDNKDLWPNYKEIVYELFDIGLDKFEHWYFTDVGLAIQFDPYVLASFANGIVKVVIPYSELTGILKDEYFPAEKDSYKGNLIAEDFTADSQANFTQFAEVILVEEGKKLLLSADGAVTDIKIKSEEIASGVTTTVMAVQSLTPGDAIMVEFDPATTKLVVSYRSSNQYETKTISYNQNIISIS